MQKVGIAEEGLEGSASGLVLRRSENYGLTRREPAPAALDRRRFLRITGAATVGTLMIRPLHVQARESFWKKLVGFFRTFAEGILLGYLGGTLPSILGNQNFLNGAGLLPSGGGVYGAVVPTPNDNAKSFVWKLLGQAGRTIVDTSFPYIERWLDRNKVPIQLPRELPIPYINGPGMTTLGTEGLVKAYLAKYPQQDADFKTGLLLPTLQGGLVDPALSSGLLTQPPTFDTNKFHQIHETESGTLVVVTYESQNVVRDRKNVVDRGQGQATLYIVPSATSNDQALRQRYKNVKEYIRRKSNYWTNEAERKSFISSVVASNSIIQPRVYPFEFKNDL